MKVGQNPKGRKERGELVANLEGSVQDYRLTSKGHYTVTFSLPASQAEELIKLNGALKRLVIIDVHRRVGARRLQAVEGDGADEGGDDGFGEEVDV